jgi:hypothetical protein
MWKDIPGWEGLYQANKAGVVRSLGRQCKMQFRKGRELTQVKKSKRYLAVTLTKGALRKQLLVHDIVLATFVGPKPAGHQARHLDGNMFNNDLANLCYGTIQENNNDKKVHGTMAKGERHGMAKMTAEKILFIRSSDKSDKELAHMFGLTPGYVYAVRRRVSWKHI